MIDKIAGWSGGGVMSMYRLVDRNGSALEVGLFTTAEKAAGWARERGWRPEVASIKTLVKPVKKNLPDHPQSNLGLGL